MRGPYGELTEEEILWDIATRLEGRMVATGIETIISRTRQTNSTDSERADIANAFGAVLVISLRCDWYHNERLPAWPFVDYWRVIVGLYSA